MSGIIRVFVLLMFGWMVWSGAYSLPGSAHFHGLILGLGVASCAGVAAIQWRIDRDAVAPATYRLISRSVLYFPWLFLEIIKSNLHVARIILTPALPIRPHLIRVPASQQTEVGRVIYANSITLTPGTISLDLRDDEILVHALDDSVAQDLKTGAMDRKVAALEREGS